MKKVKNASVYSTILQSQKASFICVVQQLQASNFPNEHFPHRCCSASVSGLTLHGVSRAVYLCKGIAMLALGFILRINLDRPGKPRKPPLKALQRPSKRWKSSLGGWAIWGERIPRKRAYSIPSYAQARILYTRAHTHAHTGTYPHTYARTNRKCRHIHACTNAHAYK